jgi:hypothetical protein
MDDYLEKLEGIYLPAKDLRFLLNKIGLELLSIQGYTSFTYLGKNGSGLFYEVRDDRIEKGDMSGYNNEEKTFLDCEGEAVLVSVFGLKKSTYLLREDSIGVEIINILGREK